MTRSFRRALGAASVLPALSVALVPPLSEAVVAMPGGPAAGLGVAGLLALLVGGAAVALGFAWLAAGMEARDGGWRLAWVLGLVLFGAVTAPGFWLLYLRPGAPVTA